MVDARRTHDRLNLSLGNSHAPKGPEGKKQNEVSASMRVCAARANAHFFWRFIDGFVHRNLLGVVFSEVSNDRGEVLYVNCSVTCCV